MKKKGRKKTVKKKLTQFEKVKRFFSPRGRVAPVVLVFVFIGLAILVPLMLTGHQIQGTILSNPAGLNSQMSEKVNGALEWLNVCDNSGQCTWRDLIVFVIVLAILFAIIYDILSLLSIFSAWVSIIISAGVSIIGVLTPLIRTVSAWMIAIASGAAILPGFIEIIVCIVIFIGLIFGNSVLAKFGAKRFAAKQKIQSIKGRAKMVSGAKTLKEIGEETASGE